MGKGQEPWHGISHFFANPNNFFAHFSLFSLTLSKNIYIYGESELSSTDNIKNIQFNDFSKLFIIKLFLKNVRN